MDTGHEEKKKLLSNNAEFYTSFPSTDESPEPVGENLADVEVKVYKRRWYILLMFSLLATTQGRYWNLYYKI